MARSGSCGALWAGIIRIVVYLEVIVCNSRAAVCGIAPIYGGRCALANCWAWSRHCWRCWGRVINFEPNSKVGVSQTVPGHIVAVGKDFEVPIRTGAFHISVPLESEITVCAAWMSRCATYPVDVKVCIRSHPVS